MLCRCFTSFSSPPSRALEGRRAAATVHPECPSSYITVFMKPCTKARGLPRRLELLVYAQHGRVVNEVKVPCKRTVTHVK